MAFELFDADKKLKNELAERKRAEEALKMSTHSLGERVKELHCLYSISELVRKEDISQEKIWQESANLLAHAYMFPEIAACCITWGGREFSTGNFKKTIWSQNREIMIHDEWAGNIEVCYLEERPKESEGPFLAEERKLIDAVADLLGKSSERKETEAALRVSEQKLTTLIEFPQIQRPDD